jgi:hypothetical protein
MTGHREPPPEWIPLIAAIVQIDDVQNAFGSALTMQIELATGRRVVWDSFPNKMVGPDSAVTFLLSGFNVIATAQGRLTTVLDNKADHAFGEIAARAVKVARGVAGFAVARLITDGIYKAHGRHGTLLSDHEPIPGDLVYARAVSFDICTGIASYSDGAKAQIVHLERTNKPTLAQAMAGLPEHLENAEALGDLDPNGAGSTFALEQASARRPREKEFTRWVHHLIDDAGLQKAMKREDVWEVGQTQFNLTGRQAKNVRALVLGTKPPEIQALYTARGAPRKSDKRKRHTRNDSES